MNFRSFQLFSPHGHRVLKCNIMENKKETETKKKKKQTNIQKKLCYWLG